jgi:hypothetical protein
MERKMTKFLMAAAVAALIAAPQAHAAANDPWVYGFGIQTCGYWNKQTAFDVTNWINGYWSGLNIMAQSTPRGSGVSEGLKADAIQNEVWAQCATDWGQQIGKATTAVFLRHLKAENDSGASY